MLVRAQGPTLLDCNYADTCFTAARGSVLAGGCTQVPHRSTSYQHAPRRVAPVSCVCFCEAGVQARGFSHAYLVRGASGIVFSCNVCWLRLVCRALPPGLVTRTACLTRGGVSLWGPSSTGTSSSGVGLRPKVSTRVGVPCRRRCIVCLSALRDGPCSRTRLKPLSGFSSRDGGLLAL